MIQRSVSGVAFAVLTCVLLASAAWAQQASGIAGAVRDTSGAVLPGVTVEAASPVLIEKVRTVVTDGEGLYSIVGLPSGTYSVTFVLPGFKTVRQDGIVLTAGFTATVNADLAVGALEETITVTGASPLVDTQNVRTQRVVSSDLLETLPTATKSFVTFAKLTPGMTPSNAASGDVGGSSGPFWGNANSSGSTFHGKGGLTQTVDGMRINDLSGEGSFTAYVPNGSATEEMTLETSGFSAESPATGVAMNVIPKSGGNILGLTASGLFSNGRMQADNFTDRLRALGVPQVGDINHIWNAVVAVGGPIKRDKLWFFTAPKLDRVKISLGETFYNATQSTPYFTPGQRGFSQEKWLSTATRVTWQVSQKDKVNIFADYETFCACPRSPGRAMESAQVRTGDVRVFQVSWIRPMTNRLLLEAGGEGFYFPGYIQLVHPIMGSAKEDDISILDSLTGTRYNANVVTATSALAYGSKLATRLFQRYSAAYVTGSHAFKVGMQFDRGVRKEEIRQKQDISYTFRGGSTPGVVATPLSLTLWATPYTTTAKEKADLGLFAQDQWKMKRMTVNLGVRFDYVSWYVPEQHPAGGRYVPARDFAEVPNVPNWKDLNPRLGAAYDLFGNGRTALKASLSRYVVAIGSTTLAETLNPLLSSANNVTRDWNDANGNYIPDCDLRNRAANGECGAFQDLNFGGTRIGTRWADDLRQGFNVRAGFWGVTTEVQQQLGSAASMLVGYYRNWDFNARVTDNQAVGPGDYSPYSITAPVDARLPGGGGYTVSGLYDLSPTKLGQVNNLVRKVSDFGRKRTQTSDFFAVSFNARFGTDIQLGGGIDTGRSVTDTCFVVDSPQQLLNCRLVTAFKDQTQVKLYGSYPLPRGFVVSAILANITGVPLLANYTVTRAQIEGLGRPLSTSSVTVPLIKPSTRFEPRRTQLDVQLSNIIQLGRFHLKPNLGLYNALNASTTVSYNGTFGPNWRPTEVLGGRLLQVSAGLSF